VTPSGPIRRFSRFPVQVPIQCQPQAAASSPPASGWTRNLSEGGACLELNEVLRTGTRIRVWLFTEMGSFPLDAHVVWKAPEPTGSTLHGVAFAALAPAQVEALRHLLTVATTTRATSRLPVEHPITCHVPDPSASPLVGVTANVSRGGLALRLTLALPVGTPVQFSLQTPQGPITGTGEVVWAAAAGAECAGPCISHGIRFTALGWAHTWSLALLVTSSGEAPSGPSPDAPSIR
jgi:hypothetical protein